jgi:hypothetical protein
MSNIQAVVNPSAVKKRIPGKTFSVVICSGDSLQINFADLRRTKMRKSGVALGRNKVKGSRKKCEYLTLLLGPGTLNLFQFLRRIEILKKPTVFIKGTNLLFADCQNPHVPIKSGDLEFIHQQKSFN